MKDEVSFLNHRGFRDRFKFFFKPKMLFIRVMLKYYQWTLFT